MESPQTALEKITEQNFESASLDHWQEAFFDLYGDVDKALPLYDIMLQLVADSTRLAEAMRRGSYENALPTIPRIFSWLCSMSSKVARGGEEYKDIGGSKSLADIIWHKYPLVCAFCAQPKCLCPALHVDAMTLQERERHMEAVAKDLERARCENRRPSALNEWVDMFEKIYGAVNAARSSAEKTFHFVEEIGEVEVELRRADRKREGLNVLGGKVKIQTDGDIVDVKIEWEDEVADVFSWLSSIYLHLGGVLHDLKRLINAFPHKEKAGTIAELDSMYSFSRWIWREFGNPDGTGLRCHRCKKSKCQCKMIKQRR